MDKKINVVLSRKTHDALQALGRKGETFDELIVRLFGEQLQAANASREK
jgi:hypothetical protein